MAREIERMQRPLNMQLKIFITHSDKRCVVIIKMFERNRAVTKRKNLMYILNLIAQRAGLRSIQNYRIYFVFDFRGIAKVPRKLGKRNAKRITIKKVKRCRKADKMHRPRGSVRNRLAIYIFGVQVMDTE